jgi:hypothetical protein
MAIFRSIAINKDAVFNLHKELLNFFLFSYCEIDSEHRPSDVQNRNKIREKYQHVVFARWRRTRK